MGRGANDTQRTDGVRRTQPDPQTQAASESVERAVDHGQGFGRSAIGRVLHGPDSSQAASAILYAVDENDEVQLPVELHARRRESAIELGGEHLIPETKIAFDEEDGERISVGEYYYGAQEEEISSLFRNRSAQGVRFCILRGDPGTGKNEWVRQMASIAKAPLIDLNLGPRFDVQDALGGDGLGSIQAKDENGKPLGDPITGSVQQLGQLARAAQHPSFICLDEPEGIEEELVSLHAAFGSDIADPGKRFLTVNSMTGEEFSVPVDPDCHFFVTFNPGQQEARLRTATHNRALNYDFEYPDEEEEARQMAAKVSKIMKYQHEAPGLQRDFTSEEVMPIVRLVRQLRNAHHNNPETFIDFPDGRQGAFMFSDLLLEGYRENKDAVTSVQNSMRYLLPGSRNMTVAERDQSLRQQFRDEMDELKNLAQLGLEQMQEDRGIKPKGKKKTTKKKTNSGSES